MSKHIYVDGKLVAIGNHVVKEIEQDDKYKIKIFNDPEQEYPMDYIEDADKSAILYSNHRHYNWDNHKIEELIDRCGRSCCIVDIPKILQEKSCNTLVYFPIYMFEHGQATISKVPFNDPWDSGLLGYLEVKVPDDGRTPEEIRDGWVESVKNWLEGNYIRYEIVNEMDEYVDGLGGIEYTNKASAIHQIQEYLPKEYGITDDQISEAIDSIEY